MSDNKLRSALVFRLSSSSESGRGDGPVTLLAKYDHASDGKDKNYSDAVGMVVGGDPPQGISEEGAIGGFKIVQSDTHQIIYGADTQGLCKFESRHVGFINYYDGCCGDFLWGFFVIVDLFRVTATGSLIFPLIIPCLVAS